MRVSIFCASPIAAAQSQAAHAARSLRSVRPNSIGGLSESEIGNNEAKNTIKLTIIMAANKYKTPAVRRHSGTLHKPYESSKAATEIASLPQERLRVEPSDKRRRDGISILGR
jgi:hypothetical protein